jgi:methanethiol oxidase
MQPSPHPPIRRSTAAPWRRPPRQLSVKELADKAGYSRPHTLHCGPEGIFLSCLGGAHGADGPGGIALRDHATFDVLGPWENDRASQYLAYDAWWPLNQQHADHQRVGHSLHD